MFSPKMAALAALAFAMIGCNSPTDPDDIPSGTPTGQLDLLLEGTVTTTGILPVGVEEVWVRFEDVLVRSGGEEWLTIGDDRRDINLMALRGANDLSIGGGQVYEGDYDAVSILVADSWIVVDGQEYELTIERGAGVGGTGDSYEFDVDFWVDQNTKTSVRLMWDLDTALTGADATWNLQAASEFDVEIE